MDVSIQHLMYIIRGHSISSIMLQIIMQNKQIVKIIICIIFPQIVRTEVKTQQLFLYNLF